MTSQCRERAKESFEMMKNMSRKAYPAYVYKVIRVRRRASLDRPNFGPKHNFSILFLRFHWSGKFILATIIFGI